MLDVLLRRKWPIAVGVVTGGWMWLALFPLWAGHLSSYPLDEPFSIARTHYLARKIYVPMTHQYSLALRGEIAPNDIRRGELRGKPLSAVVDWTIQSVDLITSYEEKDAQVGGIDLWRDQATMNLSSFKLLPRGEYWVSARLTKSASQLTEIDWHLVLIPGPHWSGDWQELLAWLGLLFYPIIKIAVIMLSICFVLELFGMTQRYRTRSI